MLLPDRVPIRLDALADTLSVMPATESYYEPASFCALSSAVARGQRVELIYWTASRNETTRRCLDPYDLAFIDDGWYAIGYCHSRLSIRMFAIQRVQSVRETGETFDRPTDFRREEYMQGSFRALRGDGDHEVFLRFSAELARRIQERTWHPSQTEETASDGSLVLQFHVSDLREVKRLVMGWGADCRVVEPKELRDSTMDERNQMLETELAERREQPSNGQPEREIKERERTSTTKPAGASSNRNAKS
jgi:predicted DNA-binding transcriptional regulator YafY